MLRDEGGSAGLQPGDGMREPEETVFGETKQPTTQSLEARDRLGYELHPQDAKEAALWEKVAAWPEW